MAQAEPFCARVFDPARARPGPLSGHSVAYNNPSLYEAAATAGETCMRTLIVTLLDERTGYVAHVAAHGRRCGWRAPLTTATYW